MNEIKLNQPTADAIWEKLNSLWIQELGKLEMKTYLNSITVSESETETCKYCYYSLDECICNR